MIQELKAERTFDWQSSQGWLRQSDYGAEHTCSTVHPGMQSRDCQHEHAYLESGTIVVITSPELLGRSFKLAMLLELARE